MEVIFFNNPLNKAIVLRCEISECLFAVAGNDVQFTLSNVSGTKCSSILLISLFQIPDTKIQILSGIESEILDAKYVFFKYLLKIKYFCKKVTFD